MRLALGVEENVRRLEIAMEHAALVGVIDCAGDGGQKLGRLPIWDSRFEI